MVESLYKSCISRGMLPSEFWGLYPIEVWWFLSAKNPELFEEAIKTKKQNKVSASEMLAKMKLHDEV